MEDGFVIAQADICPSVSHLEMVIDSTTRLQDADKVQGVKVMSTPLYLHLGRCFM